MVEGRAVAGGAASHSLTERSATSKGGAVSASMHMEAGCELHGDRMMGEKWSVALSGIARATPSVSPANNGAYRPWRRVILAVTTVAMVVGQLQTVPAHAASNYAVTVGSDSHMATGAWTRPPAQRPRATPAATGTP